MKTILLTVTLLPLVWSSACRATPSVAPATAANALEGMPSATPTTAANALEVTYLANEGFMIAGGGRKVLIDALFGEGLDGYAVVSPAQRALLEQAREPFADMDAVFATHFHDDHFNATAVLAHLTRNPQAFFFSTPQAADIGDSTYNCSTSITGAPGRLKISASLSRLQANEYCTSAIPRPKPLCFKSTK